jgi:signal transduction histidine kinase
MSIVKPSFSRARLLYVLLSIAVGLFVAVNAYFQTHAQQIEDSALSVADNAAPSIQRLTRVLSTLRHMEIHTGLAIGDVSAHRPLDRRFFEADDHALHAEIGAYLALPAYAGERELFREADQSVDDFERAVDRVLGQLSRKDVEEAREEIRRSMHPAAARASIAIERLIDVNAEQVSLSSWRIVHLRKRVRALSYLLELLAITIASLLIIFIVRATRATQRLSDERRRTAEVRADELEKFAGRVAHDLKNPLQAIGTRVQLAQRRTGDESFVRLSQQVRSMSTMIDGLLEFAMSGAAPQKNARADLARLAEEVTATVRDEAEAREVTLKLEPIPATLVVITAGALTSILSNLLRNAIKFTAGRPVRQVCLRGLEQDSVVRIEVEDTGPGIPVGEEQTLFAPFVRLESTQTVPGLGLGLATVKRLVEAWGGEVGVRSVVGEGACFWVELPRADEDRPSPPRPPLH